MPLGSALITTQGILQQQRDYIVEEERQPFLSFLKPFRFTKMRSILTELRSGFKAGNSSDFYTAPKESNESNTGACVLFLHYFIRIFNFLILFRYRCLIILSGCIAGCLELRICLEEDINSLFGGTPYECPSRPAQNLNLSVISSHITRIGALFGIVTDMIAFYNYAVGWEDPILTGTNFMLFLFGTLRYDSSYGGSTPFFLILVLFLILGQKRFSGKSKQWYIDKETQRNKKVCVSMNFCQMFHYY